MGFFNWPSKRILFYLLVKTNQTIAFCKYSEPCTLQDFQNKEQFPDIGTAIAYDPSHTVTGEMDLNTVHVKILHHSSYT
jgi:hypothetical protein